MKIVRPAIVGGVFAIALISSALAAGNGADADSDVPLQNAGPAHAAADPSSPARPSSRKPATGTNGENSPEPKTSPESTMPPANDNKPNCPAAAPGSEKANEKPCADTSKTPPKD